MPFRLVSSSAEAAGTISGAALSFESSVANALIPDGTIAVTVELVPDRGLWDDYDDNAPLGYTMTITNGETIAFTAPISVEIGDFTLGLVDYVANSAEATGNTVENASYDDATGVLTFTLTEDIAANGGVATITFDLQKPATP